MGAPGSGDQALQRAFNDADESINVTVGGAGVTLEAGDIELGAVELKNGTDDTRAKVGAASGAASGDNALVVAAVPAPFRGTFTDRSGSVTAGGTRQQVMAANANRRYLLFQNVSTGDLWVRFGANANGDQPSILVPSRRGFVMKDDFINTDALDVFGATTGQAFSAKEA
jgi:hypothetical protein